MPSDGFLGLRPYKRLDVDPGRQRVRENAQNHGFLAKMYQRVRENAQNLEPSATLCLATKGAGFLDLRASQRQTVRKFAAASPTRCLL